MPKYQLSCDWLTDWHGLTWTDMTWKGWWMMDDVMRLIWWSMNHDHGTKSWTWFLDECDEWMMDRLWNDGRVQQCSHILSFHGRRPRWLGAAWPETSKEGRPGPCDGVGGCHLMFKIISAPSNLTWDDWKWNFQGLIIDWLIDWLIDEPFMDDGLIWGFDGWSPSPRMNLWFMIDRRLAAQTCSFDCELWLMTSWPTWAHVERFGGLCGAPWNSRGRKKNPTQNFSVGFFSQPVLWLCKSNVGQLRVSHGLMSGNFGSNLGPY